MGTDPQPIDQSEPPKPKQPDAGDVCGTIVEVCFIAVFVLCFVFGVVLTVRAVRDRAYYRAPECVAGSPLQTRDCVHLVPVMILDARVHTITGKQGTTRQLVIDLRGTQDDSFRPQVTLDASVNWDEIRNLPTGSSVVARYYNGSVQELQVPDGTRLRTEAAPQSELTFGLVLIGIPVGLAFGMLLLILIFDDPMHAVSRFRRRLSGVALNLFVIGPVAGVVAARGYAAGSRHTLIYVIIAVAAAELIYIAYSILYDRRKAKAHARQKA